MRVKRYQDGGQLPPETVELLKQLKQRRELRALGDPTSAAPASTTRVAIQPPVYTSPEAALLDQAAGDYVGFSKIFGEPLSSEDAKYLRETQELPSGAIETSYPIAEFLSPVGDIKAMGESDSALEFAMAAGLAFLPGNASMLKNALPDFVRVSDIKPISKIIGAIDEAGDVGDAILSNAEGIVKMSPSARARLSESLEDLAQGNAKQLQPSEYSRLKDAAEFIKNPSKKAVSGPPNSIGNFKLHKEGSDISYRDYDTNDFISLAKEGDGYTIVGLMDNTSPASRGRAMVQIIKEVPKGAKVKFGSANDLSTDSYVFPIKYIENGKAKVSTESVEFLPLNDFGGTPKPFADLFGIEEYEVGLIDGTASFAPTPEMLSEVKSKIDAKLTSIGLPESKLSDFNEILMPHFDMIKQVGKGEYKFGGSLKAVKKALKGFRSKR
jgi:hypothetical protein